MYLTEETAGGSAHHGRDQRLGSLLGRLRYENRITQPEYLAGDKWRKAYLDWIKSIEAPDEMSDDECEAAKARYLKGLHILEAQDLTKPYCKRKRVVHAVNSIAVFEDPEELGDFEYTLKAARVGLADLSKSF
jgi:hypothetical protein